jgi:ABC-type Fe3+/spermidine/putrescine transport system ATPase subunit
MNLGRIVQVGPPHEVYERPRSRFVADFIGVTNILPTADGRRWRALRPEKIALSAVRPEAAHCVAGKIVDIAYEGDRSLFRIATDEHAVLLVSTANVSRSGETYRRSQAVWLSWAADAAHELEE